MMILMDKLSDKPNWHEKIFDQAIVAKWHKEAMEQSEVALYKQITDGRRMEKIPQPTRIRLISEAAFDYVSYLAHSLT